MKHFIAILFTLVLAIPSLGQNANWYSFGGLSLYTEDVDTLVGDGIGFSLGVGTQFNKTFGVEFFVDGAATLDPSVLVSAMEDEWDITLNSYEIETQRNFYTGIVGTFTFPVDEKISLVGKVGYVRYSVESKILLKQWEDDYYVYEGSEDLSFKEQGNEPAVSFGLLFPIKEKSSFEVSLTKHFGDAEALSLNGIFRYNF